MTYSYDSLVNSRYTRILKVFNLFHQFIMNVEYDSLNS